MLGFRSTYAMPLATVIGVRSSWETFARKSAFDDVPCRTSSRSADELILELTDQCEGPADLHAERDRGLAGQDDDAALDRPDRVQHVLRAVVPGQVSRGSGREGLRDEGRVVRQSAGDHACAGRHGAEAPDEFGTEHAFHAEIAYHDVGASPSRGFHSAERVRRDLDLEVGGLPEHVVLEARDLVGRVAKEHVRGHLLPISALREGD